MNGGGNVFDLFEEFFDLNDDGEVDVFEYGVEVMVVTEISIWRDT